MNTIQFRDETSLEPIRSELAEKRDDVVLSMETDMHQKRRRQAKIAALASVAVGVFATVMSLLSIEQSTLSAIAFLAFLSAYAVWMGPASGRLAVRFRRILNDGH